ncbi:MAG: hypothetical protein ACJAWV_003207 [Flammeovirgaceae bacterium]|jgi:hypothetical protein
MFDNPYPIKYKGYVRKSDNSVNPHILYLSHTYTFSSIRGKSEETEKSDTLEKRELKMIIRIEEFEHSVCAIKFYPKSYQDSPNKFSVRTNQNDTTRVLASCINAMTMHLKQNPYASFCFVGESDSDEEKVNTQRFRVYKNLMENVFSQTDFQHLTSKKYSSYILRNRLTPLADVNKIVKEVGVMNQVF